MKLVDTHCHLDLAVFDQDRELVLAHAVEKGVSDVVIPAIALKNWAGIRSLINKYDNLHAAYGLHPMFISQHELSHLDDLAGWLRSEKVVAVGECGLDFFIFKSQADLERGKKAQYHVFHSQMALAQQYQLPVIVHSRKSLDLVLKEIRQYPDVQGVVHSFSGSEQQAYQLIDQGFYLGFGGTITYTRAKKLRHLVTTLPLDALLLETDAPDQPDAMHYRQRNEPAFLINIAEVMAELRGVSVQTITRITSHNAAGLFGLSI